VPSSSESIASSLEEELVNKENREMTRKRHEK